jgi:hypothetical protein
MPKKVAGTRWAGKKTILADSADEAEEQQQQEGGNLDAELQQEQLQQQQEDDRYVTYVRNGITIVMPKSKVVGVITGQEGQQQQSKLEQCGRQGGSGANEQQQQQKQEGKKSKKRKGEAQEVSAAGAFQAGQKPKKKKEKAIAAAAEKASPVVAAADGDGGSTGLAKVKWSKLAQKILEGAPKRRMKLQKLHQQVLKVSGLVGPEAGVQGPEAEALMHKMLGKLRKAEGFAVCEKYVRLS